MPVKSNKTKKFILEDKVLGAVTPDYYKMGFTAINMMFECLYKGVNLEKIKNDLEYKIIVKENL